MPYLTNPNAPTPNTFTGVAAMGGGTLTGTTTMSINGASLPTTTIVNNGVALSGTVKFKPSAPPAPPPGWTVVKREYCDMSMTGDVHESPVNGKQCYVASLSLANDCAEHHFELFTRLHPCVDYLICGMAESAKNMSFRKSNVIFPHLYDFELFENWFAEYVELFSDKEALYSHKLPPPPSQMNYSHQMTLAKHDSLIEACLWFRENCVSNVYLLSNRLFFLNDQDAIAYKLRFA